MKIAIHKNINQSYKAEEITQQGKMYLKVPVVMMVEGVHCGSHGNILHTAEELKKSTERWNDVPVTIQHPQDSEGTYISANTEGVQSVGKIINVRWEDEKLKATALIDEQKILAQSPSALAAIKQNKPMDVSVGCFSEELAVQGQWHDEEYEGIATNYIPDHLALLPGDVGACSWEDGCGVRVNKQNTNQTQKEESNEMKNQKELKHINKLGFSVNLMTNDKSLQHIFEKIHSLVNSWDNEAKIYYVEDVFDDYFVYKVRQSSNDTVEMYKTNYTYNETDDVLEIGEKKQVRKEVNYKPVQTNKEEPLNINNKEEQKMTRKDKPTDSVKEKVNAIIVNERTNFTKCDEEFLLTQSEEMLDKLIPKEENKEPVVNEKQEKPAKEKPQVNEQPKTAEDYINQMPMEMQDQMKSGLRLHNEHRSKLISTILTNTKDVWNEDELKNESTEKLEKLSKSVELADYSGNGGSENFQTNNEDAEEPLLPINVTEKSN